jgi:hypothetical protein
MKHFLLPGHSQIVPVSVVIPKSVVSSRLRTTPEREFSPDSVVDRRRGWLRSVRSVTWYHAYISKWSCS